ncbi:Prenyltransferase and squalene oxidase repeat family protein [Trichomonas vaginalis G3]|uniref:Prenyltransferase and squalene oxidase repeat family protein n=1 Tax=Trichomonas vaginalis (strain ATCC PRA-98 / G3) TaxID=412133 RepID=A2DUY8_TRIV3|nr:CAAX-protein geranylgeranyltransferase protein [Trichomonas vaginalis G3]EAY15715.1 Prenyltransferase and squalene oxidase repeat family protein [Trichomonas vaginalis G3]KAI5486462.1 CAAX-protein geranylgeranyltransferase protein [Trichomonas vaginalis G3]|eukprot:XP_001327938.1 Prenyltransferase and squalene oxidase repeat family protein [Trichomonas vaginalis G3]
MELNISQCVKYFSALLKGLPPSFEQQEIILTNLVYFSVNSLALLGALDSLDKETKDQIIEWIYKQQVHAPLSGGFRPSCIHETPDHKVEESHITMTYCALAVLILLGDNLERVEKDRIFAELKSLQLPNGTFMGHHLGSEADLRFTFCAAAICALLGSNGDLNIDSAINYILDCQTYEGGFAHEPGQEAHGGATYCAISSLKIWGAIDRIKDKQALAYWLSQRQDDGFNGRTNKLTDTCYSFWIGAPLKTLGWFDDFVNKERLTTFIFSNYCGHGMFRSNSTAAPDLLHTHFSLVGLSLCGFPGLEQIDSVLGLVSKHLPERIRKITQSN